MSKLSYRHHKKTGTCYVYSIEKSYWDKEKKSPRNKQTYLGKLDPKTGELIPAKRRNKCRVEHPSVESGVTVTSKVAGPYLMLQKITHDYKLDLLLKKCFPDKWEFMLSLIYFIVHKGTALSRSSSWSTACLHPFNKPIAAQRVSELLQEVLENQRQCFFSLWLKKMLEKEYLCYDVTSISSYARSNEYTSFGYNRDREALEQVNLAMLFGQKSCLPAYYRRMPGNITDVTTLKTTMKSLNFLGVNRMHLVLDRGFYSASNIDELYKRGHKFTMAIPSGRKWVESYLEKHMEGVALPENYVSTDVNEALYAVTELHKWGEKRHRAYLHIYYNAERAAREYDAFTRKIIAYKKEYLAGKIKEEHKALYERYLCIKETPKQGLQVSFNEEEILRYRKRYSGFFCIISNKIKDPEEALRVYRTRDVIENTFDDLKNHLDMKRIRVHTSTAMDNRIFLQFIALIYINVIRSRVKSDEKLKHLSAREVLEEMETLTQITYSNRYGKLLTELTPLQKRIVAIFGIELPA